MPSNTINTRIKLKYDSIAAWNSSNFIPYAGEACIAVIPTNIDPDTQGPFLENLTNNYAIGVKIGDGTHRFIDLPWIQGIAGDVYSWAKAATPPNANQITATYNNNQNSTVQEAINGLQQSLGNIVAQGVDASTLGAALAQLQEQLAGQTATVFRSNELDENSQESTRLYPTKIIRSITQNGLTITAEGDAIELADLPDIPISKLSDLAFMSNNYNSSSNKIATASDLSNLNAHLSSLISSALTFIGISTTEITDGGVEIPTINNVQKKNINIGDVVLYNDGTNPVSKEFLWVGDKWELLGDEGSYAIKGSIGKTDLNAALQTEIDNKLNSDDAASTYVLRENNKRLITDAEGIKLNGIEAGAQVNTIESVSVNNTPISADNNKNVNITVPITTIKTVENNVETVKTITNYTLIFDPIAFDGDVKHLKQSDTILLFDCGDSTRIIE